MKMSLNILLCLGALAVVSCNPNDGPIDPGIPPIDLSNFDKVTHTYDDAVIRNPERGWYAYNAFNFRDGSAAAPIRKDAVQTHVDNGITIIHNIYHMYDFVDKPLSQAMLDVFEANMNTIRECGAKCLLRFAYSSSYDTGADAPIDNSDAPFDVFSGHIAQLKPLLQKHGDVLFAMEAGFIGAWGEWYYTSHYNYRPSSVADYQPRRQVLDKLLDAVPKDRMICVRYPAAKIKMFDLQYADSVTVATAFNQSDLSRVAMHNDCFVANGTDMGTFSGAAERDFWSKETRYMIMGGETCRVSSYAQCDNTITQMENFHYTYLNTNYNTSVISGWRTGGCYDEIDRRLGYRLSVTDSYYGKQRSIDKPFDMVLYINSNGFAGPMNPRDMEIVFAEKGGSGEPVRIKTDVDPRFWFAGQTHEVRLSLDVSPLTAGKTYEVFLNLPDPETKLNERPEYSIRLANKDMWNETTGYNKLNEITF